MADKTPPSPRKKNSAHPVTIVVLIVLAIVVIVLLVLEIGISVAHWRGGFIKTVSRVVPYPAATVSSKWLKYHEFIDTLDTLDAALSKPDVLQASGQESKPSRSQLEVTVLDRMIKDEIVRRLAAERGIVISETALDAEIQKLTEQSGNQAEVEQKIRDLYGWDVLTFSRRVVRPFLTRQQLQEKISADDTINAEEKARAESALERVKAGTEDFQAIAREINEDVTKTLDGDLGIFGHGERDQTIEEAAFSLEVGQISGLVRTSQGFHILKLLEKLPADEKTGDGEKVHVAHVFIQAKPLDEWLFEQAKRFRVNILLRSLRWDANTAAVVRTDQKAINVPTAVPNSANVNR